MSEPSGIEKTAGNIMVQSAANAVAVFGATITPLAAFVPFLVDTLASGRQSKRVEGMLRELNELVQAHSDKLKEITDDQYKVVNEAIAAAFYTIDRDKLEVLKRAAANAIKDPSTVSQISDSLSRLVREISAVEAAFVVRNLNTELFVIADEPSALPKCVTIKPNSSDEIILSGLINLGLLYSKVSRWDMVAFEWSPLASRLVNVIKDI